jgi:hypothetical protein
MSKSQAEHCNICNYAMTYTSTVRILAKFEVQLFQCCNCHLLRTQSPFWLPEAYTQAIAATDTGIVMRNLKIARQLTCVLPRICGPDARFLDVAGGTGLLTRLMRDNGFNFFWEDIYCQNVLARGFEADASTGAYDAVTAFEALEHMEQPYEFIKDCVARSKTGTFIFTTELYKLPLPPENWWYFSLATGQHIAFFSLQTLQHIAMQLNLRFMSHRGMHLFTRLPLSDATYADALDSEAQGTKRTTNPNSLTITDHLEMTKKALLAKGASEAEVANLQIQDDSINNGSMHMSPIGWTRRTIHRWKRSLRKRLHKA